MRSSRALTVVGAVTVTFNSEDVLDDFLASAGAQVGVELRLYVVDSGSSDRTVELVRAAAAVSPRIVLIENAQNVGFAEGSNQGIVRALSDGVDWVLLVNNDTRFGPDLVQTLVESATTNELDVVSPLILATEPENAIWYAGGTLSRTALVARHRLEGAPAAAAPSSLMPTEFGSACCLLIRPAVFAAAGMFDPVFFVYFDDVDLAARVKAAGFQYWIEPKAVLVHKASALTGEALAVHVALDRPELALDDPEAPHGTGTRRSTRIRAGVDLRALRAPTRSALRLPAPSTAVLRRDDHGSGGRSPSAACAGGGHVTSEEATAVADPSRDVLPTSPIVVAVVPLFSPPASAAKGLVALAGQVDAVALVDDGSPTDVTAFVETLALPNARLIRSDENLGIARALNRGVEVAITEHAADFVVTVDQDSVLADDYVQCAVAAARLLVAAGVDCTAIAAGTVDGKPTRARDFGHPPFRSTRETIQSGMVFSAEALRALGPFDESFFIDCVDTDYILRGTTAGRPTIVVPECRMEHAMGDGIAVRLPFFFPHRDRRVPYHGPVRRYYITRNRARLLRRHAVHNPAWAVRQTYEQLKSAAADLVYGPDKVRQLQAAAAGLIDGLLGKGGRIGPSLEARLTTATADQAHSIARWMGRAAGSAQIRGAGRLR